MDNLFQFKPDHSLLEYQRKLDEYRKPEPSIYNYFKQQPSVCPSLYASYYTEPSKDLFVAKCDAMRRLLPSVNFRSRWIGTKSSSGEPTIGIVTSHLSSYCSVTFTSLWKAKLLDYTVYGLNENTMDGIKYKRLSGHFHSDVTFLESEELDVIIYPALHLNIYIDALAMCRLAPVQLTTWGHSDTSGMDSIDYYYTSDYFEEDDCQKYYSESVIKDTSLSVYYYNLIVPNETVNTLDTDYILCAASPYKWNDSFMDVIKTIQDKVGVKLVIIEYTKMPDMGTVINKLKSKLIDFETITQVSISKFMSYIENSLFVLDTWPFGNCNITFQTLSRGKCILTYPSSRLYGKFTQGLYTKMGFTDLITHSWDEYIDKAVDLVTQSELRYEYEKNISSNSHKIFNDTQTLTNFKKIIYNISSIPSNIHFVYGLKQVEEMCFVHFMAVWSAIYYNKPDHLYFWYHHEPVGKWWDLLKPLLTLKSVPADDRFAHHAHYTDMLRLTALYEYGGIYMDIDTVSHEKLDVMAGGVTIGFQTGPPGLCNAIIASAPRARFIQKWITHFDFKNIGPPGSAGWDYNAVKLPLKLAKNDPNILIKTNWHKVHWGECEHKLFDSTISIEQPIYHLCETMYYEKINNYIYNPDDTCTYSAIIRPLCEVDKTVHMTWKNEDVPDKLQVCIDSWKKHYTVKFWTDATLRTLINDKLPKYLDAFDNVNGILKAGLGRLVVLYLFGGIYADCDIELLKPIPEEYLEPLFINVAMEPPDHGEHLCDAFFATSKGNPFILSIIDAGMKISTLDAMEKWGPRCWQKTLPPTCINFIPTNLVYPIRDISLPQFNDDITLFKNREFCVHYWPRTNMLGIPFGEVLVLTNLNQYIDKYRLAWTKEGWFLGYVSGDRKIYSHDNKIIPLGSPISRGTMTINKTLPYRTDSLQPLTNGVDKPTGTETLTWAVAVYNRKDLIKDTLDSILAQKGEFKCIICDDGSTDGSMEYIHSLVGTDPRFRLLQKQTRTGYPSVCRLMNNEATTDIVAIVDSDDVLLPCATEKLIEEYRTRQCTMVVSSRYECDSALNVTHSSILNTDDVPELERDQIEHIRSWRKSCLPPEAFGSDIMCAEDRDLFYKMEELGTIVKLIEPLVYVRHHKNSIMSSDQGYTRARHDHCIAKIKALSRRKII